MKVAIVIERCDVSLGGAERLVCELASALAELGLTVDIVAAKGHRSSDNVHILCDNFGKRVSLSSFAKAVSRHAAENHYDIIHSAIPLAFADVYQPPGGSFVDAARRNAASYQNVFVTTYKNATGFVNRRRTEMLQAEKELCENHDRPLIAALSQYVAEQFEGHYSLSKDRIAIIPNGVKTDRPVDATEAGKLRSKIIANLKISPADKPVFFLFGANNFRLKGLACLIQAMLLAASNRTERQSYLIVAGSGSPSKYQKLARKLNIDHRILFLGALDQIQNALTITDVAVLPTFYDPSSRFILEGLAAAKPVITTKFNGAADLFVNDRHGKVIDRPENISALAEAITYFSTTDNIKNASQAIIADSLKEKVSINRVAEQLVTVYNKILAKRPPL
jgi:UDP-glucose:(heptosyl)LPS alpha-1,3-glucosyltransferase